MKNKHHHGIVILIAVIVVVAGVVIFYRPQANPAADEQFRTHIDKGMSEEVRAEFDLRISTLRASIDASEDPELRQYLQLANLYYQVGDLALSKQYYEMILAESPNDVPALENLGVSLEQMGDYSGAAKAWSQALELSGNSTTALRLAKLVEEHFPNQRPELKGLLEKSIETFGQEPVFLRMLGDWYANEGDYERALSHYEAAKSVTGSDDFDELISEARQKLIESENNK